MCSHRADDPSHETTASVVVDGAATGPIDRAEHALLELRSYTLRPGQREVLIDVFDRELVETQEAVGMSVLGQFRDLDDPDRFVWLRAFADAASRRPALEAFYDGPVWAAHGRAAASTMVDSDDVLLLRPYRSGSGIRPTVDRRPPPGTSGDGTGLVVATVLLLEPGRQDSFPGAFDRIVAPALTGAGAVLLGVYEAAQTPNDFPRLPVREDEVAFVWFTAHADQADHRRSVELLGADERWSRAVAPSSSDLTGVRSISTVRLVPTARSRTVGAVGASESF